MGAIFSALLDIGMVNFRTFPLFSRTRFLNITVTLCRIVSEEISLPHLILGSLIT